MAAMRYPSFYREVQMTNADMGKMRKIPREYQRVSPMTDNFFKFGLTGSTRYDDEEFFHWHLKWILWLLRVMGAFPVKFDSSGFPEFKLLSLASAYSMCFFLLINSLTWVLITDFCSDIQKLGADLSDSIYSVLFIASFTFCIWIPLLTWLDARSTCRYFKAWAEFQLKFRAVTKDRVQLNIRKYSIVAFLPMVGSGLFVVLLSRMTPHSEPWKMPVPITGCVLFSTLVILKIFMFIALHKAGTALDSAFKRDLAMKPTSPNLVEEYRLLWLRWSRLVSQEEDMFGTVYAFTLVKMLFIVVITLYCSLMDLKTGQVNYERQLNTCSPCAFGMATLYFICRNAHRLSDLGKEFQKNLEIISPSTVSSYVWLEVKFFLDTIRMNPPVVTAIGFTNVNKPLFVALMSSMVTYMIVLLQFDRGDSSSLRLSSNSTNESPTSTTSFS